MKQKLKTREVIERLAVRYASPSYGFLTQVRNGTGMMANRTADAIAMSLWPSRGLNITGFEVKVSRTDWIKELKNPEKAEDIAQYCHYWYLVVGDDEIVQNGELPTTWGLIVPHGKGLKVKKEAIYNKDALLPDYVMLAGIFRNFAEQCIPKETIASRLESEYVKGKEWAKYDLDRLQKERDEYEDAINTFEKSSGIKISKWDKEHNKNIGQAVDDVLNGRDKEAKQRVFKLLERTRNLVKYLEGEDISRWDS